MRQAIRKAALPRGREPIRPCQFQWGPLSRHQKQPPYLLEPRLSRRSTKLREPLKQSPVPRRRQTMRHHKSQFVVVEKDSASSSCDIRSEERGDLSQPVGCQSKLRNPNSLQPHQEGPVGAIAQGGWELLIYAPARAQQVNAKTSGGPAVVNSRRRLTRPQDIFQCEARGSRDVDVIEPVDLFCGLIRQAGQAPIHCGSLSLQQSRQRSIPQLPVRSFSQKAKTLWKAPGSQQPPDGLRGLSNIWAD